MVQQNQKHNSEQQKTGRVLPVFLFNKFRLHCYSQLHATATIAAKQTTESSPYLIISYEATTYHSGWSHAVMAMFILRTEQAMPRMANITMMISTNIGNSLLNVNINQIQYNINTDKNQMNEIKSEFDGEIVEIYVNDEEPADYGKSLFKIM